MKRIERAQEDLYQADAIEPDDDGLSFHITDVGRRFTEPQAQELPEVVPSARPTDQDPSRTEEDKPLVGSWIVTLMETFLP